MDESVNESVGESVKKCLLCGGLSFVVVCPELSLGICLL